MLNTTVDRWHLGLIAFLLVGLVSIPIVAYFDYPLVINVTPTTGQDEGLGQFDWIGQEIGHPKGGSDVTTRLQEADLLLWIAADAQPSDSGPDQPFNRLRSSADDIDHLPFEPSLIAMPGDIPNPSDATNPENNITRTLDAFNRIEWFEPGVDNGTLYVTGNHERGFLTESLRAFADTTRCGEHGILEVTADRANLKLIGLCRSSDAPPIIPRETVNELDKRLSRIAESSVGWNVLLFLHQPIPGTVYNCLSYQHPPIYFLTDEERSRFLAVTREHASVVTATVTGHIHGLWTDPGRAMVRTPSQTFIDAPVFGSVISGYSPKAPCIFGNRSVGNSMFVSFNYGSEVAKLHIRHSCDDYNQDGQCDRAGYWAHSGMKFKLDTTLTKTR